MMPSAQMYKKLSVPFEKLPPNSLRELREPATQTILSKMLLSSLMAIRDTDFFGLISAIKPSHSSRSIAYCYIRDGRWEAESYLKTIETFEQFTSVRLNDRINSALVAFVLHELMEREAESYINSGVLSERAFNDIINIVKSPEKARKLDERLSSKENINTGSAMNIDLDEACRLAFGVSPKNGEALSPEAQERHELKMKKYYASLKDRKNKGLSLVQAISKLEKHALNL